MCSAAAQAIIAARPLQGLKPMAIVAMQVDRAHPDALFPVENTGGAAFFQFAALVENPEGEFIGPGGKMVFRTGLKIMVPNSWIIEVYPRSAQDLANPNRLGTRVGLLDFNFHDEVTIEVANEGKSVVRIMHGDIIADAILTQVHGARFIDRTISTIEHAPAIPGVPNAV